MGRKRDILSMSQEWQNFLLSIFLHLILPLSPLILELWFTQTVTEKTMTLAASMYTIAIGVSSRNPALFGLAILLSILLATAFGYVVTEGNSLTASKFISAGAILSVFVFHVGERYNRHVVDKFAFLQFDKRQVDKKEN